MDIGKVREAALAHYEGLTEDQKQAAQEFFEAMDTDKSGSISIDEFMDFLSHAGFQIDNHDWLFAELDKDDNGTLDFKELVTFHYIVSREEYKELLNSRPSTDEPRRKGQRRDWGEFFARYNKLQGAYQFGQSLGALAVAVGCHIV
ncbi:hypothetical protein ACJRO7_031696 [Eucalyptus globulus]|uniref:EF-hand domain-containing protein n=1 Tax=Eucalyptus globulus TaxID=34317 RepID=A0ABD3JR96_EUCGL